MVRMLGGNLDELFTLIGMGIFVMGVGAATAVKWTDWGTGIQ